MAAYKAALAGEASRCGPENARPVGDVQAPCRSVFCEPRISAPATRTQRVYRLVIDRFLAEHGHRRVAEMQRDDVKKIMALKAATPGSANDLLKKIRTLIKFAIDTGWCTDDPTLRIKTFPEHEFHTWTEDEIAQYEERWPIGSRERTAFALHLYTGQRRSDVARMAWTDVAGNAINVVQAEPAPSSPFLSTRTYRPHFAPGHASTWLC